MTDTLNHDEWHPMAEHAVQYVRSNLSAHTIEAIASCAIEGNRAAEICMGTIHRLQNREPVSDRYILGLAWMLREMKDND
jgi:hypothetical protein